MLYTLMQPAMAVTFCIFSGDIGTITATSTSKLVTTQPRKISQISADLNTDTDGETGDM